MKTVYYLLQHALPGRQQVAPGLQQSAVFFDAVLLAYTAAPATNKIPKIPAIIFFII